jgi:DNA-binding PadR family transcriptional regulator
MSERSSGPELSRGEFGLLLLGLLRRRPMYGYELLSELRRSTNNVVDLPEGTVYPALRRMERDALVEGYWVDMAEGTPRRRYYRLTIAGERALVTGREDWVRFRTAADAVLGS